MQYKKYRFDNREQFIELITNTNKASIENGQIIYHNCDVVELGYLALTDPIIDENGIIITPSIILATFQCLF